MEIFKLIVTLIIFICVLILSKGYFSACEVERKGSIWHPYPKRKPKRGKYEEFKTKRYLLSLDDDTVIIGIYDFEKNEFEYENVDAWREVPPSYKFFRKQLKIFKEKLRKN